MLGSTWLLKICLTAVQRDTLSYSADFISMIGSFRSSFSNHTQGPFRIAALAPEVHKVGSLLVGEDARHCCRATAAVVSGACPLCMPSPLTYLTFSETERQTGIQTEADRGEDRDKDRQRERERARER